MQSQSRPSSQVNPERQSLLPRPNQIGVLFCSLIMLVSDTAAEEVPKPHMAHFRSRLPKHSRGGCCQRHASRGGWCQRHDCPNAPFPSRCQRHAPGVRVCHQCGAECAAEEGGHRCASVRVAAAVEGVGTAWEETAVPQPRRGTHSALQLILVSVMSAASAMAGRPARPSANSS